MLESKVQIDVFWPSPLPEIAPVPTLIPENERKGKENT